VDSLDGRERVLTTRPVEPTTAEEVIVIVFWVINGRFLVFNYN